MLDPSPLFYSSRQPLSNPSTCWHCKPALPVIRHETEFICSCLCYLRHYQLGRGLLGVLHSRSECGDYTKSLLLKPRFENKEDIYQSCDLTSSGRVYLFLTMICMESGHPWFDGVIGIKTFAVDLFAVSCSLLHLLPLQPYLVILPQGILMYSHYIVFMSGCASKGLFLKFFFTVSSSFC